jgi:hypothetical protein
MNALLGVPRPTLHVGEARREQQRSGLYYDLEKFAENA